MKILIVEDDPRVAGFVEKGLREDGHVVDRAADGVEGSAMAAVAEYDVVVLDVMLPRKSGFHVAAEMRARGDATPILMLTAKDAREDIIHGLDVGADDYRTKPFDFDEFLARLRALSRRVGPIEEGVLRFEDLEMDRLLHSVRRGGRKILLTPMEFKLLEALLRGAGRVVRRTELLDRVWGMSFDPGTNLIDVHIANLRKKLEADGGARLVWTVRGAGYRLTMAEEE